MSGPIKPSEVDALKQKSVPEEVFDAFNELIVEKIQHGRATIKQEDVVDRIVKKLPETDRPMIFNNGWLDVEPVYRAAGWSVSYDKPGYNESGSAFFTFASASK